MTRTEIIERALYDVLFVKRGMLMTFGEAMGHTSGEPISVYGSDIPLLARRVQVALDAN